MSKHFIFVNGMKCSILPQVNGTATGIIHCWVFSFKNYVLMISFTCASWGFLKTQRFGKPLSSLHQVRGYNKESYFIQPLGENNIILWSRFLNLRC
jgi:hypothetical protein